jgi:hypothetical protein
MIEEMRMKNVYKIELRSADGLSYERLCRWLKSKHVPMTPVRGKMDTYWVNKYVQIETGHDCFYVGANGDLRAWEITNVIFKDAVVSEYPFSNLRHVKIDINNQYNDDGLSGTRITYAKDILKTKRNKASC